MTDPETLTAEERAYLSEHSEPEVSKLFSLYTEELASGMTAHEHRTLRAERDAALARAEAADKTLARVIGERNTFEQSWRNAESRLAEANRALGRVAAMRDRLENAAGDVRASLIVEKLTDALTPAPAAKAEPECSYAGRCNSSRCPKHGVEHPDTIALRECRAELEQARLDLQDEIDEARAERDTARADLDRIRARAMQDADRELEALTVSRALVERIEAALNAEDCWGRHWLTVQRIEDLIRAAKEGK